MKYYDFKKAKKLVEEAKDSIESAALGMHEDWFWTATEILADGVLRDFPENAHEIYLSYRDKRKAGMSLFSAFRGAKQK